MHNGSATHQAVLDLTCELVKCASVTPEDAGAQTLLANRLKPLGFEIEYLNAGGVTNLWAVRPAAAQKAHFMFAGHTDVVPTGPEAEWDTPPFEPSIVGDALYGRGTADMKASLAAMVVAVEELLAEQNDVPLTVSFLITSDEEGEAIHGTRHVVDQLIARGIRPDYCVVGEPSSSNQLGDVVRCGRRGSINAELVIRGMQGHVAYPDLADNPIHRALAALDVVVAHRWDEGNEYYPPTSLQISNINAGTGATNVIPGELHVRFNLRYCTEQTAAGIQAKVRELLEPFELNYDISWQLSGEPFLTQRGTFTEAVSQAIEHVMGIQTELSTSGGTSDGRFIAPWSASLGPPVPLVELGPRNATIHKINEQVALAELAPLAAVYGQILRHVAALPAVK